MKRFKQPKIYQAGAFVAIDPNSGYIEAVFIQAADDQQQHVVEGALARITRPNQWGWLRRLFRR